MFEYFKSKKDGQWYWRLKARNGKVIASSEGYRGKAGALQGIRAVIRCLAPGNLSVRKVLK